MVIGTDDSPADRFPRYNNMNTGQMTNNPSYIQNYADANNPTYSGSNYRVSLNLYSYGNFYSWAAAAATTTFVETEVTSICPSGWALPTSGNSEREYARLSLGYGGTGKKQNGVAKAGDVMSNRFRAFPNNYLFAGYYDTTNASAISSSVKYRGEYGDYWSRSKYGNYYGGDLHLELAHINPSQDFFNYKYRGYSVRCLVDENYIVQYDGNGADNPNGMGTMDVSTGIKSVKQTFVYEGLEMTLLASNFKRDGYGFAGWSTDQNAWSHFTDDDNSNDPIIYGPMETIIAPVYPSGGVMTLYAVWIPAAKDGNNNPVYLQEWDDPSDPMDGCAALTGVIFDDAVTDEREKISVNKNSVIALTDKRDNMTYTVAKLADGNCWMTESLKLDNQYTMGQNQNDSSVTNESLAQGYGGTTGVYGNFVGLADPETSSSSTDNSVYKSSANPPIDTYDPLNNVLEDIGTTNYPTYRFPRYNNDNTTNLMDSITYSQSFASTSSIALGEFEDVGVSYRADSSIYSYGNYYSWAAAIANTNYYADSSSEATGTSICPAGWHLPSGGSTEKEWGILVIGYGGTGETQEGTENAGDLLSNRLRAFPANFVFSGSPGVNNRGNCGMYWSRSAESRYSSYRIFIDGDGVYPSGNNDKRSRTSVRCLADH